MNFLTSLWDRMLFLLSAPKCVRCGELLIYGNKALCNACLHEHLNDIERECSRCNKKLRFCTCSNFYLEANKIKSVIKLYRYNSKNKDLPGNRLIYALKHAYRSDVIEYLASELAIAICNAIDIAGNETKYIVTNVPRRKKAIVRDGYDHSAELAREVAKNLGVKYIQLLSSKTERAQKEMTGSERKSNVKFELLPRCPDIAGATVILVDDIITTGSSIVAATKKLRILKPKSVLAASIAIAYKDSCIKPIFKFQYK